MSLDDCADYTCPACGETVEAPVDATAGDRQQFVIDCPVCCCPNVVSVEIDRGGVARARAAPESDPYR